MATKQEVALFIEDFNAKMKIWDVLFRDDRGKNIQTLADLDIRPAQRKKVLENLAVEDYSQGPMDDTLHHSTVAMWIFGKQVKKHEVYIKITMGLPGTSVICISFHISTHPLKYPYKV